MAGKDKTIGEEGTSNNSPVRILLVEDDQQVATMIESLCNMHKFHADHVSNCKDALMRSKVEKYDLVMLDVNLSDGSGLHIIPEIRNHQHNVDIMTMTGDNPLEVESAARKHGVIYHLIKPFRIKELMSVLLLFQERKGKLLNN